MSSMGERMAEISTEYKNVTPALVAHSEWGRILKAMLECSKLTRGWSGSVFRIAREPWHRPTFILNGEGSRRAGARWTPRAASSVNGDTQDRVVQLLVQSFPTV